jgi:hypothetical protein
LSPSRRASLNPIAIACLRLFTFRPLLPERSLPRLNSCISSPTFCWAFFPYFLPELRRPRLELLLREELRRERDELLREEALVRRDDADLVRRCPLLLRRPVAERPRELERVDRERDDDELFPRELDVDLRVAIVSSLLHTQTTAPLPGLRSVHARLYRRCMSHIE